MAATEEHELQIPPMDVEMTSFTPRTPHIQAHHDSTVPNHHDNQSGSDCTIMRKKLQSESIETDINGALSGNVEDKNNIQGAGLSKESFEYHITDIDSATIELEHHTHNDSTLIGTLSPGSEKVLQNANITISTVSPEVSSQFLQRHATHEDFMDEINSTFKFAKMESAHFVEKEFNTKSNRHSRDLSNTPTTPNTVELNQVSSQHKNRLTLPLKPVASLALHKSFDETSYDLHLQNDFGLPMLKQSTSLPTAVIGSNTHIPVTSYHPAYEASPGSIAQENSRPIVRPINKETSSSDPVPNYQSMASSAQDILDPQQAKALEFPDAAASWTNTTASRSSRAVADSETSSRRSHLFQKGTPNSRVRIKQPFPEVAQHTASENQQINTLAANRDQGHYDSFLGQPITAVELLSSSYIHPKCPSNLSMLNEKDTLLHLSSEAPLCQDIQSRISTGECLDSEASRLQRPTSPNCPISSNEQSGGISVTDEAQNTNTEPNLVESEPQMRDLPEESTPYESIPHRHQNGGEESHTNLHASNPQEQSSTRFKTSENILIGDAAAVDHSDNGPPSSENQMPVHSSNRHLSSHPQRQFISNLIIPILEKVPGTCDQFELSSDRRVVQYNNNASVKKPNPRHNHRTEVHRYSSPPIQQPRPISKVAQAQENLIKHNQEVEDILNECQLQKEVIQLQQSELESFKASKSESCEKIQSLEADKGALKAKIKKLEQLSIKYKNHMNEVVISQKHLMRESQRIQKVQTDIKIFQASYDTQEVHIKKLESLLHEAKEFRAPAEKLLTVQKENGDLTILVQESSKINRLLQSDLDKNAIELGRERHNVSQLQKQLNAQIEAHKELIDHLQKTRCSIVEDLTSESGILMRILYSGSSTQEKIEQLLNTVNSVKSHGEDLQPILAMVFQNISIKVEEMLRAIENKDRLLQDSHLKHFGDLKQKLDQVHHDQKTESHLNTHIMELRETSAALSSSLRAREADCQDLTKRIGGFETELASCRGLLSTKCDELAVARAIPKDDPILRGRFQNLERENASLKSKVDVATHETMSIKEELGTLRKTLLETENELHQLRDKYNDVQNSAKKFSEEKKIYISNAKLDVEKARQEVAKASIAAKNELIMRNDALVKNLEQRRAEAELQVATMKEELRQMQSERESCAISTVQLQRELSSFREDSAQQVKHIEALETQSISREALERQATTLKCAQGEIGELRTRLDLVQNEATGSLDTAIEMSRQIENHLRQVNDLEQEKESLREQNAALQEKYDALSTSTARATQRAHTQDPHDDSLAAAKVFHNTGPSHGGQADEDLSGDNFEEFRAALAGNHITKPHDLRLGHKVQPNGSDLMSSEPISISTRSGNALVAKPGLKPSTIKSSRLTGSDPFTASDETEGLGAPSLLELPYRQLKNANRKSLEASNIEAAPIHKETASYNLRQSTVTRTPHTSHVATIRVQTPVEEIIPFSNFSPIQPPDLGSLADVSPIMDHLETTDLHKIYALPDSNKRNPSQVDHILTSKYPSISTLTNNTSPNVSGDKYRLGYQPLNDNYNDISAASKSTKQVLITKEPQHASFAPKQPVTQKTSTTLKSALKKPTAVDKPINSLPAVSNPAAVLKHMPSNRGVNKNQRRSAPELGYKRVASGQVIKSKGDSTEGNDRFPGGVSSHCQSSQSQPAKPISQKSPLMPGPKRNDRKRPAPSVLWGGDGPKLPKAPRTSLHFKSSMVAVTSSQTVPNSQEDQARPRRHH